MEDDDDEDPDGRDGTTSPSNSLIYSSLSLDPLGNTWGSGITGGCEGGLGNSGNGARLDWSSTSTRGGLEGVSDATRTHTGWVAGRLHWSSSNAGTRGMWGGDHDWSSVVTCLVHRRVNGIGVLAEL